MATNNTLKLAAVILGLAGIWGSTITVLIIGGINYFWLIFASFGLSIAFLSIFIPSEKFDPILAAKCAEKGMFAMKDGSGCNQNPPNK